MTGAMASFRELAGDALLAVGELVRGGSPNLEPDFDETAATHTKEAGWTAPFSTGGVMESDGPSLTWPAPIPNLEVRSALAELADSQLLEIAAKVIAGWKPILLVTSGDLTDVDVLVDALRDRAAQFADVERDAGEAFLTPAHLGAHLT